MTKISVIIPVRNEAEKIERCLDAVFNQTITPFEVIVVEGHSTDGTVKNAGKFSVKILYEDYGTVGGARQVGVENAEGEYVAFMDADCGGIFKIKIAMVTEHLAPKGAPYSGGVDAGTINLAKNLAKNNEVHIITTFTDGTERLEDYDDVEIDRVGKKEGIKNGGC